MNKQELKGKHKRIEGVFQEEVGKLTDNKTEELKGKVKQIEGRADERVGELKRRAKKVAGR
jgi:CsbD-like.